MSPRITCQNQDERIAALTALMAFELSYRRAWKAFQAGDKRVLFPPGTWRWPRWGFCRGEPSPMAT
ncbi:MAG: hypothetical protein AAF928_18485 [Myxococcota bacterium]